MFRSPHGILDRRDPPPRILLLAFLPLGDTLFATPMIRALRERYPQARLSALAHAGNVPLLCCVPALDDVLVLPTGPDWHGLAPLLGTLRTLRARRYDVAIDLTSPIYKWISMLCGIPVRTYMKFDRLWWLLPARHRRWRATHMTQHYYECARELDLPPWDERRAVPWIALPDHAREAGQHLFRRWGILHTDRPLICIHMGGTWLHGLKRWPSERFVALADRLQEQWEAHILLLGGPEDALLVSGIAARMRHTPIMATRGVPLLTSLALIEGCDLFIGNDSSLLHAAAALGTPFVGIYGPTNLANFRPLAGHTGQGMVVLPGHPCCTPQYAVGGSPIWRRPDCRGSCRALATISVDAVYEQAVGLLARHRRTGRVGTHA
ncbi:MAG TPA: glycosyltransferase family 9 protein [Chloroflexota bacterium]|nr:glycosyltransferase family 9 protein [Chloroflexota bacterium]